MSARPVFAEVLETAWDFSWSHAPNTDRDSKPCGEIFITAERKAAAKRAAAEGLNPCMSSLALAGAANTLANPNATECSLNRTTWVRVLPSPSVPRVVQDKAPMDQGIIFTQGPTQNSIAGLRIPLTWSLECIALGDLWNLCLDSSASISYTHRAIGRTSSTGEREIPLLNSFLSRGNVKSPARFKPIVFLATAIFYSCPRLCKNNFDADPEKYY